MFLFGYLNNLFLCYVVWCYFKELCVGHIVVLHLLGFIAFQYRV